MGLRARTRSLWRALRGRPRFEAEMAEEFRHHILLRTEHLIREGVAPAEAARRARLEFGSVEGYKEQGRASRGLGVLDELRGDLRYGARSLRGNPGFTLIAVLILALGIGANTAIFSVVSRVLLRPLPVEALDRLVVIREDLPALNLLQAELAPAEVVDLDGGNEVLRAVTGFNGASRTLTGFGEPVRLTAAVTIGSFAEVFRVRPHVGRFYGPEQSTEGPVEVAVLSHGLWQQLSGGDPAFLGRTIELNGTPHEVIGVLPPDFAYPRQVQVWVPFAFTDRWRAPQMRGSLFMTTVARLRDGVTTDRLQAHLDAQVAQWNEQYHSGGSGKVLSATPFVEYLAGPLRVILLVLMGAVLFVLMIAAANVGSLQLVRTTGRSREMAVRGALGAGRRRLARQLLVESALLGAIGGAAGLALGAVALRLLGQWELAGRMHLAGTTLDPGVLALTLAVVVLTTIAFGTLPALRAARVHPQAALRQGGRGTTAGPGRHRLLRASLVAQVALALVLLLGSALMVRTLRGLLEADPGFDARNVTTAQISIPGSRYDTGEKAVAFFVALLERVRALPVDEAALVWGLPFSDQNDSSPFDIPGRAPGPDEPERHAEARIVSPGYFRAMRIPLLRGRDFDGTEHAESPPVVIVDEVFARQFFPGEDPVGQRIRGYLGGEATIIGVAGRVDHDEVGDAPKAVAYYSYRHQPWMGWRTIVVRSSLEPTAIAGMLRSVVADLDPGVPLYDVQTMEARIERSLGPRRLAMVTLVGFGALSLLVATMGVYGVMRYTTNQRRQEIGVRLAIGAEPRSVVGMVVAEGLGVTAVGIALGTLAALGLTRFMSGILYGVSPQDPFAFAAAAGILAGAAAVASWLPARRASRIDPLEAIRME